MNKHEVVIILVASGYRRVSLKHRMIARVDRPYGDRPCERDPDWCRRCVSEDVLIVPVSIIRRIPTSCNDHIGLVEKHPELQAAIEALASFK